MKLFTKEVMDRLEKQGNTRSKKPEEIMVVAKFFNPAGVGTWYVYDYYRPEDGGELREDGTPEIFTAFANLNDPLCAECGDVSTEELESFKGRFGLGIEREIGFKPRPLHEIIDKIKSGGHV